MLAAGGYFLRKQGKSGWRAGTELLEIASGRWGWDQVAPFDPARRSSSNHFATASPLMSMAVARFVDEVVDRIARAVRVRGRA